MIILNFISQYGFIICTSGSEGKEYVITRWYLQANINYIVIHNGQCISQCTLKSDKGSLGHDLCP